MGEYLTFKKMITPMVIQILFWIGVVLVVISGLMAMVSGEFLVGLLTILLGPVLVRVYAEIIMVMFKINDGVQRMAAKD